MMLLLTPKRRLKTQLENTADLKELNGKKVITKTILLKFIVQIGTTIAKETQTMKSIEDLALRKLKNVFHTKNKTLTLMNGLTTMKILNGLQMNTDGLKKRRKMVQKWKKQRTLYHFSQHLCGFFWY